MISGLRLILLRKHNEIANEELKGRLEEVYLQVRNGYRIHIITSGEGVPYESKIKLDAFVDELGSPTANIVQWDEQALAQLQDEFYRQSLPAVREPLQLAIPDAPYARRSGSAECYMFSLPGNVLAELYKQYGESLLQRNIRVDQRDTATNRSIELTCSGDESKNFLHFNNGVTFLCETARYDPFHHLMIVEKGQVVNGGQTIRALHRAYEKYSLKPDVEVPARAITAAADKDFANNVAVNQNNQNQIGTGFLRSNDQVVVQLDHALAALGWFLERREGELKTATNAEKAAIEARIGHSLEGRIIRLKEGAQAYTATFFGQPEVAKKNVKKIFLSTEDGGFYEKIFSAEMTANKIVIAHQLKEYIDEFIRKVNKTKAQSSQPLIETYRGILGDAIADRHSDKVHQVLPQCAIFVCGTIFRDLTALQGNSYSCIPSILSNRGEAIICEHLLHIMDYAKNNPDKADKSWPVLLKSNPFFLLVMAYIQGIRSATGAPANGSAKAVPVAGK